MALHLSYSWIFICKSLLSQVNHVLESFEHIRNIWSYLISTYHVHSVNGKITLIMGIKLSKFWHMLHKCDTSVEPTESRELPNQLRNNQPIFIQKFYTILGSKYLNKQLLETVKHFLPQAFKHQTLHLLKILSSWVFARIQGYY